MSRINVHLLASWNCTQMLESIFLPCLLRPYFAPSLLGKKKRLKTNIPWNLVFTVVVYKLIKFAGKLRLQLAMVKWRRQTSKTQTYLMVYDNTVKTSHGRNIGLHKLESNLESLQHAERGRKGLVQWGSGGEAPRVWMTFLWTSSWGKDISVD